LEPQKVLWEGGSNQGNGSDGIKFSSDKSVAEGVRTQVVLGTRLIEGSMISLQFVEGNTMAGVALEGYENRGESYQSKKIIVVDNGERNGLPIVRGEKKFEDSRDSKQKSKVGVGDTVRVVYDGKCVDFFANQQEFNEKTPWFRVEDVTGQVRPVVIFGQRGKVKVEESKQKHLVLSCIKTQEDKGCTPQHPCDLCVQQREKRASDLLGRLCWDLNTAMPWPTQIHSPCGRDSLVTLPTERRR
jgi:hypothetical protein